MNEFDRMLYELVLNWKLRLVASALFSLMGLSFLIGAMSGILFDYSVLDQTIVGISVFVVTVPIYLIIADLPKINEQTITKMLNEYVPEFEDNAHLILVPREELDEHQLEERQQIESIYKDKKLYRYLPNRPITQAIILMVICFILTAGSYYLI